MNTLEILKYFKNIPNFKGVFPRDRLPDSLNLNTGIIINTDKAADPGQHWVSIYKNRYGESVYFDSFGLPPLYEEFTNFLDKTSQNNWTYNNITFQSVYQDTCGMYCVFFLACMLRHEDFDKFRSIFNFNADTNDIRAKILYKMQI